VAETGEDTLYARMHLVTEALHQYSILDEDDLDDDRSYSWILGNMLESIDNLDDFDQ